MPNAPLVSSVPDSVCAAPAPAPASRWTWNSCVDRARSELGSERFDTAYRIGSAMAPGEAASLVLSPAQD